MRRPDDLRPNLLDDLDLFLELHGSHEPATAASSDLGEADYWLRVLVRDCAGAVGDSGRG